MIGILCNRKRECMYARRFLSLVRPLNADMDIPIVIFRLPNVNLSERIVSGNIISKGRVWRAQTPLPKLIFNFSIQCKKSDIKKLRSLAETDGITIVNAANQYNQWSIMEMLSENHSFKKLILPFTVYSKEDIYHSLPNIHNFIFKSKNGSRLSRTVYVKKRDSGICMYSRDGKFNGCPFDISDTVSSIMNCKKWLLLETPELVTYKDHLLTVRIHLQKNSKDNWTLLSKAIYPSSNKMHDMLAEKLDVISIHVIEYINCFIPDIGICHLDFVFDIHGTPYILDFGGCDIRYLCKKQNKDIQANMYQNMFEYAGSFFSKHKGEVDYVG